MTSFTAISSRLQCTAINQNGGNFLNFEVLQEKEELTYDLLQRHDVTGAMKSLARKSVQQTKIVLK